MEFIVKAVIDSDILIDYLDGILKAKHEIELYEDRCISVISWMEVMAGAKNADEERICRNFLDQFILLGISPEIAEKAVQIRKKNKIKLPDAIIWATAQCESALLVTRNAKDFSKDNPGIRIPYHP